jgi:hypothetical protein
MTYDDATTAAHPQAPATELARIVNTRPDLRAVVAANPAAQPALLEWLASLQDPAVNAALASRRAPAPPQLPPTAPVGAWSPQAAAGPQDAQPVASGWGPPGVQQPAAQSQAWGQPGTQQPTPDGWGPAGGTATLVQEMPFQSYESEPRGSRRKLWIGLVATAVILVGGGALAAYLMVFSKLGGAATPEAAVTQLIEGAVHKDGVAMYGVMAPSEVSSFGDMVSPLTQATDGATDPDQILAVLDTLEIDLKGLKTSSEPIGDGLAKVSVVGGTLTVDGDAAKIVAEFSKLYAPMLAEQGMDPEQTDLMMDEATAELDKNLPWTVNAADLTWDTDSGTNRPFLVSVKEGDSWYVSPLMSVGEYIFSSGSELTRGAMPSGDGTAAASPEAAGTAFVKALAGLFTGDAGPLADVLPTAEARFVAVYGQAWLDDVEEESAEDVPTVEEATFSSKSIGENLARLTATKVVLGGAESVTIEGTCATDAASGQKMCLSDTPMAKQLGMDQLGLVAVEGSSGWKVSILATFGDASRIVADKIAELKASGELDGGGTLLQQLFMQSYGASAGFEDLDTGDLTPTDETDSGAGFSIDENGNLLDENGDIVELDPETGMPSTKGD